MKKSYSGGCCCWRQPVPAVRRSRISSFSPNAPEPSSSWVRSQDDALETLAAMLENLEGSESTRAASVRQIRSSVLAVLDETVLTPDDLTRSLPDGAFHD